MPPTSILQVSGHLRLPKATPAQYEMAEHAGTPTAVYHTVTGLELDQVIARWHPAYVRKRTDRAFGAGTVKIAPQLNSPFTVCERDHPAGIHVHGSAAIS